MRCGKLLLIVTPGLDGKGMTEGTLSLPGRSTEVRNAVGVGEDRLNLLQRLTRSFWEQEQDVEKHRATEDTEKDVHLPLNINKCRRNEVTQREVEGPVEGGGQRISLATDTQWEQLRRIRP